MADDNYPDDIRQYDSDPRSPFFVEPEYVCEGCNLAFEASEMSDLSDFTYCNECWHKEDEE